MNEALNWQNRLIPGKVDDYEAGPAAERFHTCVPIVAWSAIKSFLAGEENAGQERRCGVIYMGWIEIGGGMVKFEAKYLFL